MFDTLTSGLAVARLTEAGPSAVAFRHDPAKPLQGYCLITSDGQTCHVTTYVENGRAPIQQELRYESWILTADACIKIGPVQVGPAGIGGGATAQEPGRLLLSEAIGVRLTARIAGQPLSEVPTILEGGLLRIYGHEAGSAPSVAEPDPIATAEPDPMLEVELDPAVMTEPDPVATDEPDPVATDEPDPVATDEPEPVAADEPEPIAADEPDPVAMAEPEPIAVAEPEPTPVASPPPIAHSGPSLTVALAPRHPLAPRATGTTLLDTKRGSLTITMRGLPSPPALGRNPATDRPFNAYRAWLLNRRTNRQVALGICSRVWGENFRFQIDSGLNLREYDTILVTVDDRAATHSEIHPPQVLYGTYSACS